MTVAAQGWERVRSIANHGYRDAIDFLACVAILERGNEPRVIEAINDAGAGHAAILIRNALFTRVHLTCMRAYDPVRNGDQHLAAAFELLKNPKILAQVNVGHEADLNQAQSLFSAASEDARLKKLRHYRNKYLAHLSEPNLEIPLPIVNDLLEFAKDTATIAEQLSFGTGVVMIDINHQVDAYRESADGFWSRWE